MAAFAERLKALRRRERMSVAELAEASALPAPLIRAYERGLSRPNWCRAIQLAIALGAPVDEFQDCVCREHPTAEPPPVARFTAEGGFVDAGEE